MAETNFSNIIESLLNNMNGVISTKTVVGEPTQIGDTIILPLVDVTFGIGAGASNKDTNHGGGGGIGGKMTPSAVLIIRNGSTKLVNIKNQDAVTKILDLVPDVIDKITGTLHKSQGDDGIQDDDAITIAFPDETDEQSE